MFVHKQSERDMELAMDDDMPHAAAPPMISVIIPHYNDLENLDRCLTLLMQQNFTREFEIIVADNASIIPLDAIAKKIAGRARLVLCEEKGAGLARNAGVAVANAARLAFIDSDCRPEPGWLAAGYIALDTWDFAGGHVEIDVDDALAMTPVEAFERVFAFNFKDYIENKRFSVTANLFVRREVFEAAGGFRVQLSEDVEWCHRAGAAGFSLGFAPDAIAGHPARKTWSELKRKWVRVTEETFYLNRDKQTYSTLRWILRNWAVLFSIAPHTFKIIMSSKLKSGRDRAGAFWILLKIRIFRFFEGHKVVWNEYRSPGALKP